MCSFLSHNSECKINSFFWNFTVQAALSSPPWTLRQTSPLQLLRGWWGGEYQRRRVLESHRTLSQKAARGQGLSLISFHTLIMWKSPTSSLLSYTLFHPSFVLALDVNSVCDPEFSNHLLVQDWRCGVWDSQFDLVPHGSFVSFHFCCRTLCYWLFGVRASAAHLLSIWLLTPTLEDKGKGKTQSNDLVLLLWSHGWSQFCWFIRISGKIYIGRYILEELLTWLTGMLSWYIASQPFD